MSVSRSSKNLAIGTGIYAVGTFGTRILMFLIVPLYTHYLDTSEMGTYDLLVSIIGLLIPIISLQIADAVYRWIIQENVESNLYLRSAYQFLIFSSLVAVVVIIAVDFFVSIPYLMYFLGALFSALYFQINQKILRGLKRQWLFAISGIVYTGVFLVLNIIQLCILERGIKGLLMSYIVANIIGIITIVAHEKRIRINLLKRPEFQILGKLLCYSIPLIPNYLSWWIVDSSDKYIVLFFLGVSSNGILAIAHKFPTVIQSVFGLFLNSWQDFALANENAEKSFFTSVFQKLYRFSFSLIWVLVPLTKLLVWIVMGKDYKIACDFIPFYYLGAIFQVYCSFYGVGYLRTKNTKRAFSSSIYGALINAVINICLINFVGLQAAAISTFVSFFVMWLIREKQNKKELEIIIKWSEFWILLLTDIYVCVISIWASIRFSVIQSIISISCFCLFNRNEVNTIIGVIKEHKK